MESKSATIFNIVHGSFVDGYGIRTTVFLKGCPLRCIWCCNPEGQSGHPEIKFVSASCNGCGRCLEICPVNAIIKSEDNKINIDRALCTNCGRCIDVCHAGALDFFGKRITLDELLAIVKKDEPFYRESEGGVTIGGGEPTFQSSFALEFIRECKKNYIHTAVDTCGYTTTDEGFKVLEEVDLLLFDLKGMNVEEHKKNTGVSNEIVLNNLKKLSIMGKPIIIRLPIIPGLTDSDENVESTAKFLSTLESVRRVDLIAYHEYGIIKHEQLGRNYNLNGGRITDEKLNDIKCTLESYGLSVQIGG
jgi:pyruvate formate lyase activating enzyme